MQTSLSYNVTNGLAYIPSTRQLQGEFSHNLRLPFQPIEVNSLSYVVLGYVPFQRFYVILSLNYGKIKRFFFKILTTCKNTIITI